MEGHDHALTGGLAFAAIAPLLHTGIAGLAAGMVATAGGALLPDFDAPGSTISRTAGFLTEGFAVVVHFIARGHRKGTHCLLGIAVFTALAWTAGWMQATWDGRAHDWWHLAPAALILSLLYAAGTRALRIGGHRGDLIGIGAAAVTIWAHWDLTSVSPLHVPMLAFIVALGSAAHIAGDELTHDGCPLLYPFDDRDFHVTPEWMRFTTGKFAESWIVSPLLLAALGFLLYRDVSAHTSVLHTQLAGYIGR